MRSVSAVVAAALLITIAVAPGAQAQEKSEVPGWLGVSIQDVTDELSEALPRGVRNGAIVNDVVEDSPAEAAGLQAGDIIVRLDRKSIRKTDDLTRAVRDAGAGTEVMVEYYRDGRRMRTDVELGNRDDSKGYSKARKSHRRALSWYDRDDDDDDDDEDLEDLYFFHNLPKAPRVQVLGSFGQPARLGVHLMELNDQLAEYFEVAHGGGALVTEVMEDTPAEAAGLRAGDVITRIEDESISDADDVRGVLRDHREAGTIRIEIMRRGRHETLSAELEEVDRSRENRLRLHSRGRAPHIEAWTMPDLDFDASDLKAQMRDLRRELKKMAKELQELKSSRP
jgi:serine protease Do